MPLEHIEDSTLDKCRKVEYIPKTGEVPVFEHMRLPTSVDSYEKENARNLICSDMNIVSLLWLLNMTSKVSENQNPPVEQKQRTLEISLIYVAINHI